MPVENMFTIQCQREKKLGVPGPLFLSFLPLSLSVSPTSFDTLEINFFLSLTYVYVPLQDTRAKERKKNKEGHGN